MSSDEYEKKIAEELNEIFEQHLDAMRRAGVAERKREGYKIESTEALRLFREGTGYLTRLRELRSDIEEEFQHGQYYHVERIIGHIEDYNRILQDIRKNPSFKNAVASFTSTSFNSSHKGTSRGYNITIEGRSVFVPSVHEPLHGPPRTNVPMDGTTTVETFVYPRLSRLTKDLEQSIIGRCASGKRPD